MGALFIMDTLARKATTCTSYVNTVVIRVGKRFTQKNTQQEMFERDNLRTVIGMKSFINLTKIQLIYPITSELNS